MKRLGLLALLIPAHASAFSDPKLFGESVDTGGGGGRYFTGSRADGYACSVCHTGSTAPEFRVDGIPDAPVAGERYELTVHWDDAVTPHALQLELTSANGTHPTVAVAPDAMLPAESRCESKLDGTSAVYTVDVGARRIVGVENCGARSVTVSFIATGGPIELAIGGVRSDASETAEGDGTFELRTTFGEKLVASSGGGCNTGGAATGWCAAALVLMAARRRRVR